MAAEPIEPGDEAPPPPPSSGMHLAYAGASRVQTAGNTAQVELFGNLDRPPVKFEAKIKNPLRFREALSALYSVVGSDYRYVPKDRTAYIAYLRLKRDTAPLGVWQAQQAYFGWLLRNDPLAFCILDPVITVHPDQVMFELVPAGRPRVVAEPWETVFTTTADVFKGKAARLIRVWGRRRLMTMKRLLPFVEGVDVYLLGSGMPSFWVFRAGDITLTLGLTGFTSANWSSALGFDLLLPRKTQDTAPMRKVVEYLGDDHWLADTKELAQQTGIKGSALIEALQLGCQHGQLMYDIANGVYRLRPIVGGALDLARLQYRNVREKVAHDLLTRRGAVRITGENRIAGIGLELTGQVSVDEDKRDYRPQMVLADEGQVRKVTCTCAGFRKQGIKAGPCVHLIALRLAFAEKEAKKAKSDEAVKFETRAFAKREGDVEHVVQISLERDKVKYRWGLSGRPMRLQTMRFNADADARAAYFAKLAELDAKGYLDAIAE